ncbi:uncharacterized protein METZ01_LOCUS232332, partial [marine metagenome]
MSWPDFLNSNEKSSIEFIENELKKSLEESFSKSTKNVSIALSSGIDSNIILAIMKKIHPEIEINAITVRFSDSVDES